MKKFSICLIIILIGILAIVNNSYATISQDKISIKTEKILEQALKEYIEEARPVIIHDDNVKALFVNVNGQRLTRQG